MRARPFVDGNYPIWLLEDDDESGDAREDLTALDRRVFAKVVSLLDRTAEHGPPANEERFKRLRGPVCEFKVHGWRLMAFEIGGGFVVTEVSKKKKRLATQRMIDRTAALARRFSEEGTIRER